jgi:hypothetical protein
MPVATFATSRMYCSHSAASSTPKVRHRLFADTDTTTPLSNRQGRNEKIGTVIKTLQDMKDEEEQEVSTCFHHMNLRHLTAHFICAT